MPVKSFLALLFVPSAVVSESYFWKFEKSDCGFDDLSPQPACAEGNKNNVAALEACCLASAGCGGFNTNAIMKKSDCQQHVKGEPACDLYVKQDHPQPPPPPPPPVNMPWPYPNDPNLTHGSQTVELASSFSIKLSENGNACATLKQAAARYSELTLGVHVASKTTNGGLASLSVAVSDLDESHPQLGDDESYTLALDGSSASLKANTIWGAMRGLETFSQLVLFNFTSKAYTVQNAPWHITDSPRFTHRGLMIDTARHFETLASIRHIVDSLPYAKINVLHWHMVDTQSFPFESKTYPKLWDGRYSNQERYTQEDIASVVEHARLRGVRVIVEFDMPGHAASWCAGYPEICPSPSCQQPLNVASNFTFKLINALLNECTGGVSSTKGKPSGLFPDNMIHLGGDEVNTACWTSTPSVNSWLQARNMTGDDGYAYFVKQTAAMAIAQGRQPVQWSEVYDHFKTALPKDIIVHVWKSVTNVTELVANGYRTLVNVGYNSKSWYLDNLNVKWDAVYSNEPCAGVPDGLCDAYVLGGHGEMWGETVDASDLEQTVWPRLAAIAERLWSDRKMTDTTTALPRIESFRCLLNRRGIRAAPVNNANARSAPPGPGGCYEQR